LFGYFIFWHITQGKDLMVITLEDPKGKSTVAEFLCFVIALFFWVYACWYSSRIIAKAKDFQDPDNDSIWKIFKEQAPRVLAFTCLSIILIAFFRLYNYDNYPHLKGWLCHILLLLSYVEYYFINKFWVWFLDQKSRNKTDWIKFLRRVRRIAFLVISCWIAGVILTKSFWSLVSFLIILQIGLVLLLIVRRELDEAEAEKKSANPQQVNRHSGFWKKLIYIVRHDENPNYFFVFTFISLIALAFYITSIVSISFAVFIGPFPFMLLAFGVLLGVGNIITYLSVLIRFNCQPYNFFNSPDIR
jgi:hypothetical protein